MCGDNCWFLVCMQPLRKWLAVSCQQNKFLCTVDSYCMGKIERIGGINEVTNQNLLRKWALKSSFLRLINDECARAS